MTTTMTFSAHLLPEYANDPEFLSFLHDVTFGNIAMSAMWAMHKYTKDKNFVPACVLGDARVTKLIQSIRDDGNVKRAVLEERLANAAQRITMLEEQVQMERIHIAH